MYSRLESLQGDVVPYFFGLQTVSHMFIYPMGVIMYVLTHRLLRLPENRRGFCWSNISMGSHFATASTIPVSGMSGRQTPRFITESVYWYVDFYSSSLQRFAHLLRSTSQLWRVLGRYTRTRSSMSISTIEMYWCSEIVFFSLILHWHMLISDRRAYTLT